MLIPEKSAVNNICRVFRNILDFNGKTHSHVLKYRCCIKHYHDVCGMRHLGLRLSTEKTLTIEFHPGDTIFFIDDDEIGCTGPHYFIRKIDWPAFISHTDSLSSDKKLLLLPMLVIGDDEKEDLRHLIAEGLKTVEIIKESDYEIMENCMIHNCLVRKN